MSSKMWGEITYTFPNFNGCAADAQALTSGKEYEIESYTLYWECDYLSVRGFKLIYVSKTGPSALHACGKSPRVPTSAA